MESGTLSAPLGTRFGQVAWVAPDIRAAERFFRETLGVPGVAKLEHVRADDTGGTYRGQPGDFVFHQYMAHSGDVLLERSLLTLPHGGQQGRHRRRQESGWHERRRLSSPPASARALRRCP